jgi:hypothetical protein
VTNIFMRTRKGASPIAWIAIAAVVGLVALVGTGNLSVVTGEQDMGPTDDDAVASLSFKVKDAQADSTSYLASSYYVYDSEGLQVASGTTATDSFTTVDDLDENADYTVRVVDDDGSDSDDIYHASKEVTTGEATERFVIDGDRQGSISLNVEEDSGTEDDSTLELNPGKTDTVTLEIEENSGDAVINEPAVFVKTNDSSVVSEISLASGSEITSDVDRLSSYDDGYVVGVDQIADFGSESVDVRVTADDSASSDATVTMAVVDGDEFQTDQDTWEFGYEDSSDNDIRLSDSTASVTVTQP